MENENTDHSTASTDSPKTNKLGLAVSVLLLLIIGGLLVWFLFFPKQVKVDVPATAQKKGSPVSPNGIATVTDPTSLKNAVDDIYSTPTNPASQTPGANGSTVPNKQLPLTTPPAVAPPDVQQPARPTGSPSISPGPGDVSTRSQTSPTNSGSASGSATPNPKTVSLIGEESIRFGQSRSPVPAPVLPTQSPVPSNAPPARITQSGRFESSGKPAAFRPSFNAILPIRLQGMVSTLFPGSTVRMEVTRECRGTGWVLPSGTIILGQVQASSRDRIQIVPTGFIDEKSQTLVSLSGEVRDREGEIGMSGKLIREQGALKRAAGRAFNVAVGLFQSYLQGRGRGTSVFVPTVTGTADDLGAQNLGGLQRLSAADYVVVEAGTEGSILVTDLPPAAVVRSSRAANPDPVAQPETVLSDDQALEILRRGKSDEIVQALPRFSPSMQLVATELLKEIH